MEMENRAEIDAGRKRRKRLEGSVRNQLEESFQKEPKSSTQAMVKLANSVRMKIDVLHTWFCNRRQKEKRMKRLTPVPAIRLTRSSVSRHLSHRDETADESAEARNAYEDLSTENTEWSVLHLTSDEEIDTSAANESVSIPPAAEIASVSNRANTMLVSPVNFPETPAFELSEEARFAERLLKRANKIGHRNRLDVYAVPLNKSDDSRSTCERFSLGDPDQQAERRTFLVLGANRSSQAQFINGIANYIFNVEQDDLFRFQLIKEEETAGEMNCIKVYDVHHAYGFRVPFSITIVAVPNFDDDADDSDIFKFQATAKMLLEFLDDGGINELNMICNLVSENVSNNQSLLSILGKDVAENITNNWEPFNYYSDGITYSWVYHTLSIQRFFAALTEKNMNSLTLTQQVLKERKLLEETLNRLPPLIEIGREKMEEVEKAKKMMDFCDSKIQSTEEDEDEDDVIESTQKVELLAGKYAYNCNRCSFTCVNSFLIKEENNEEDCASSADNVIESSATPGFCSICPDKCNFSMHSNQPFRWVYTKQEMRNRPNSSKSSSTESEMKWREIKAKGRDLIAVLQLDLIENGTKLLEKFKVTWGCIQQLNKIALNGTSFLTLRVFDILNNAEQQLKKLGYQEEIKSLKK